MPRICATIALLGYLWGGLFLPAVHQHAPHGSAPAASASSACVAAAQGCAHEHLTTTANTPDRATDQQASSAAAAGWQAVPPSAHACQGFCLLCQLASTSYLIDARKARVFAAELPSSIPGYHRQLPPPSQRRTMGYLRGPPTRVS